MDKKRKQGRPIELNPLNKRYTIRFTEEEVKEMNIYAKKHNFDSIAKLIRKATIEKIRQTDLFID